MTFLPGVELARRFYTEVVRPLVDRAVPGRQHSAALFGPGSEVLGFDTERSTDHDWGPRVLLFLDPSQLSTDDSPLRTVLDRELPATFAGYPTRFPDGHRVVVTSPEAWFDGWLGFDPRGPVQGLDWLATPTQRLAEFTGGAVFHDGLGALVPARANLRWYPRPVWYYVLAAQWQRIAEEEPFVGRCAEVGDEVGAAVVTARLARDLMRLSLLLDRRYPPYSKWLGRAVGPGRLGTALAGALAGRGPVREEWLGRAYARVAAVHNGLGLTPPLDPSLRLFWDRPFRVLDAGRFAAALRARIGDPEIAGLPPVGAIDQFADSTALLGDIPRCRAVTRAALFG